MNRYIEKIVNCSKCSYSYKEEREYANRSTGDWIYSCQHPKIESSFVSLQYRNDYKPDWCPKIKGVSKNV